MKTHERLRESLNNPIYINYIYSVLKKRLPGVSQETYEDFVGDVVETLLYEEVYYEEKFEHSLRTYINLVVTRVIDRQARAEPVILVDMDRVLSDHDDEDGAVTGHDLISEADSLLSERRYMTEDGVPDILTYYLAQLPAIQADVFAMKAVLGYTHAEIASLLDISEMYSKRVYSDAQRTLRYHLDSEQAYRAQLCVGNTSGQIISHDESSAGVWNDWSWKDSHAEPGPVKVYSKDEIAEYCLQRGLEYKH